MSNITKKLVLTHRGGKFYVHLHIGGAAVKKTNGVVEIARFADRPLALYPMSRAVVSLQQTLMVDELVISVHGIEPLEKLFGVGLIEEEVLDRAKALVAA